MATPIRRYPSCDLRIELSAPRLSFSLCEISLSRLYAAILNICLESEIGYEMLRVRETMDRSFRRSLSTMVRPASLRFCNCWASLWHSPFSSFCIVFLL